MWVERVMNLAKAYFLPPEEDSDESEHKEGEDHVKEIGKEPEYWFWRVFSDNLPDVSQISLYPTDSGEVGGDFGKRLHQASKLSC